MHKKIITLIFFPLLTLLYTGVWAQNTESHLTDNPLGGRDVFVSKGCRECHSVWGSGGTLGPDLVKISRNRGFLEIVGFLWNHSPKMVTLMESRGLERPEFTQEEMESLITYLYYLNYFNEPGDFDRGKDTFEEKGCSNCHTLNRSKAGIGPSLDRFQQEMSPIALAQALWNHGPQMAETFDMIGVKRFEFTGNEISDVLSYIRGAAPGQRHSSPTFAVPGNPEKGKLLFKAKRCNRCHTTGLVRRIGPGLGRRAAHKSVVDMAALMWNRGPVMWKAMRDQGIPFPEFSGNELADLTAYIYFLRFFDTTGNVKEGKKLFEEKHCATCHSLSDESSVGPNLTRSEALKTPAAVAAAMWNHAPEMEDMLSQDDLKWPTFAGKDLNNIMAYIENMRKKNNRSNRR